MRISDWSSDVCSSDLRDGDLPKLGHLLGSSVSIRLNFCSGLDRHRRCLEHQRLRIQSLRLEPTSQQQPLQCIPGHVAPRQPVAPLPRHQPARVQQLLPALSRPLLQCCIKLPGGNVVGRSEEHTSELQSLMRISYAVFCLTKKIHNIHKMFDLPSTTKQN